MKAGDCRVLYGVVPGYDIAALSCVGKKDPSQQKPLEECDVNAEMIRHGVSSKV